MRKSIFYILLVMLCGIAQTGCYEDKGNYDYTTLDTLSIKLPVKELNVQLGDTATVVPEVQTDIPETDLDYFWQIYSFSTANGRYVYMPMNQDKNLNYVCQLNDLMPSLGTYQLRLCAKQKSTGREFYSALLPFSISGLTGLLVLHNNGDKSDIGIIRDRDFMLSDAETKINIMPHWYSASNGGSAIEGHGKSIIQHLVKNMKRLGTLSEANIIVIGDKGATVCDYPSMKRLGGWESLFAAATYQGHPQYYSLGSSYGFAVDNGYLYARSSLPTMKFFGAPDMIPETNGFTISSQFYYEQSGKLFKGLFYDGHIRGFAAISSPKAGIGGNYNAYTSIFKITTSGETDISDLQADCLSLEKGGASNHYLGVMQRDNGERFVVEMDPTSKVQDRVFVANYSSDGLQDFPNAIYFTSGDSQANMCYYATKDAVYHYTVLNGRELTSKVLTLNDGTALPISGDITMLKVIKPYLGDFTYYNSNKILLVATYGGLPGTGKLYSLSIDQMTGLVKSNKVFQGFDKIVDATIKAL